MSELLEQRFVPVPAAYIDNIMPALTDTEWRVLLVVIRQTLGWSDASSTTLRKRRDWLSHSQLRRRTGKSGDSISRAVASLVGYGLLVVESEGGKPLLTAGERRRERARLFYRLESLPVEKGGK